MSKVVNTELKTREDLHKIVKELEFSLKQIKSRIGVAPQLQLHKKTFEEFIKYSLDCVPSFVAINDKSLLHLFLFWMCELDAVPASDLKKALLPLKDAINGIKLIHKSVYANPFSKVQSFKESKEFRNKFLAWVDLFPKSINELSFLYVDKNDVEYNENLFNSLLSNGMFDYTPKSKFNWANKRQLANFVFDFNNACSDKLLVFAKENDKIKNALMTLSLETDLTLSNDIDQFLKDDLCSAYPMLRYFKRKSNYSSLLKSFESLSEIYKIDTDVFKNVSLKLFLKQVYGFNGRPLVRSFMSFAQSESVWRFFDHIIVGNAFKKRFSKSRNFSCFIKILDETHLVKLAVPIAHKMIFALESFSDSQFKTLFLQIGATPTLLASNCDGSLDALVKILSTKNEAAYDRFWKFFNKKSFCEKNTWLKLFFILRDESQKIDSETGKFEQPDSVLLEGKLVDGYSIVFPETHEELADLSLKVDHWMRAGESPYGHYIDVQNGAGVFGIYKGGNLVSVIVYEIADKILLHNDAYSFIASHKIDENDVYNRKAQVVGGDYIITNCIGKINGQKVDNLSILPNDVLKSLCEVMVKNEVLSESYLLLLKKAGYLSEDFIFELKEKGMMSSSSLEMLSWGLNSVFTNKKLLSSQFDIQKVLSKYTVKQELISDALDPMQKVISMLNDHKDQLEEVFSLHGISHNDVSEFEKLMIMAKALDDSFASKGEKSLDDILNHDFINYTAGRCKAFELGLIINLKNQPSSYEEIQDLYPDQKLLATVALYKLVKEERVFFDGFVYSNGVSKDVVKANPDSVQGSVVQK